MEQGVRKEKEGWGRRLDSQGPLLVPKEVRAEAEEPRPGKRSPGHPKPAGQQRRPVETRSDPPPLKDRMALMLGRRLWQGQVRAAAGYPQRALESESGSKDRC